MQSEKGIVWATLSKQLKPEVLLKTTHTAIQEVTGLTKAQIRNAIVSLEKDDRLITEFPMSDSNEQDGVSDILLVQLRKQ